MAHAASSTTPISRSSHSAWIASRSAGVPPWCTTMTARVRTRASRPRSSPAVRSERGPVDIGEDRRRPDVAHDVGGGDERKRRARSPRRPARHRASTSARCSAVVHDDMATPCGGADACRRTLARTRATRGPWATHPDAHRLGCRLRLLGAQRRTHDRDRRRWRRGRRPVRVIVVIAPPRQVHRRTFVLRATSRRGAPVLLRVRPRLVAQELACAVPMSASRRGTGFTARSGP